MRVPLLPAFLLCCALTAAAQKPPLVFDLNEAIVEDDMATVEAMLGAGVDVNARDLDGRTPLTLAASHRKREMVRKLLDAGANPLTRAGSGMNAIAAASSSGDPRTLGLILAATKDPRAPRTALMVAVGQGHLDIVRMLLEAGADPGRMPETSGPVYFAAEAGLVEVLDLLLQFGATANGVNEKAESALFAAVANGRTEVLPLLLSRGADPKMGNPAKDLTPLALAVLGGRAGCARTLISYGADVNRQNEKGETVLHRAAKGPRSSMIDLLVSLSADVDLQDEGGATPLFLAVAAGRSENVRRLLAARADKSIANKEGLTPLDQARKMERPDLVELLE